MRSGHERAEFLDEVAPFDCGSQLQRASAQDACFLFVMD
jgi:hypothetical protein